MRKLTSNNTDQQELYVAPFSQIIQINSPVAILVDSEGDPTDMEEVEL